MYLLSTVFQFLDKAHFDTFGQFCYIKYQLSLAILRSESINYRCVKIIKTLYNKTIEVIEEYIGGHTKTKQRYF